MSFTMASIWDWLRNAANGKLELVTGARVRHVDLPDVMGLGMTSNLFRVKVVEICDRRKLNADFLVAVMSFETAGSFSPSQRNLAGHDAVGFIQFTGGEMGSARYLNTTTKALSEMSDLKQLGYVERYFAGIIAAYGPLRTLEAHYTAVLGGRPYNDPSEKMRFTAAQYEANKRLDASKDGIITAGEATDPCRRILDAAKKRPRIVVKMPTAPPTAR